MLQLPEENLLPSCRLLLEINFYLNGVSTAVKGDVVFVKYVRLLEGLGTLEIDSVIKQVSSLSAIIRSDVEELAAMFSQQ